MSWSDLKHPQVVGWKSEASRDSHRRPSARLPFMIPFRLARVVQIAIGFCFLVGCGWDVETYKFNRALKVNDVLDRDDVTETTLKGAANANYLPDQDWVNPDEFEFYVGRRVSRAVNAGDSLRHDLFDPRSYFGAPADLRELPIRHFWKANTRILSCSPDNARAVAVGDESFVLNPSTGHNEGPLPGPSNLVAGIHRRPQCFDWTSDGQVFAAFDGREVSLFDFEASERNTVSLPDSFAIHLLATLAITPNGRFLAVGQTSGNVAIIEVETGKVHFSLNGPEGLFNMACLPDNQTLVGMGRETVVYYNLNERRQFAIHELPRPTFSNGKKPPLSSVVISRDGQYGATGTEASELVLWQQVKCVTS